MSLSCPWPISEATPSLCRSIDIYCERTGAGLDAEPLNALTNAAFLFAAAAAWQLNSVRPNDSATGYIRALCAITAVIGVGSFTFHTVATAWASWADIVPILAYMLLYLWIVITRFFAWASRSAVIAVAVFFVVTFSIEAAVPSRILWGGAYYLPALFIMAVIAAALYWRGLPGARALAAATAVFLCSFAVRTLDAPICPIFPVGTHFLWHLLNAFLLYLLTRAAILHAPPGRDAELRHL